MAVDIKTGGTLEAGVPEPLFRNPNPRQRVTCWKRCISANGQRFLVNEVLEASGPAPLTIGTNWTSIAIGSRRQSSL